MTAARRSGGGEPPSFDVSPQRRYGLRPAAWLTICLLVQLYLLQKLSLSELLPRLRSVEHLSAIQRSAVIAFGDDFAGYLEFLLEVIPLQSKVVIPPASIDYRLGEVHLMQFYLMPREITNCPSIETMAGCVLDRGGPNTYILAIGGFPPKEAAGRIKRFIVFDGDRGVYAPP